MEILGRYRNAADFATLQNQLSEASAKLTEAKTMIAKCEQGKASNFIFNCHSSTGKTLNDWRDLRDRYSKQVAALQQQIFTLTSSTQIISKAQEAQSEAEAAGAVETTEKAKKVMTFVYIGAGLLIAGLFVYLKLRKK